VIRLISPFPFPWWGGWDLPVLKELWLWVHGGPSSCEGGKPVGKMNPISPLGYLVIRLTPLFTSFLEWERGSARKGQSSDPEGERLAWQIGDPMVIRLIYTPPALPHFLVRGKRAGGGAARLTWSLMIPKVETSAWSSNDPI
jgi:hypothetical protein